MRPLLPSGVAPLPESALCLYAWCDELEQSDGVDSSKLFNGMHISSSISDAGYTLEGCSKEYVLYASPCRERRSADPWSPNMLVLGDLTSDLDVLG